MTKRDEKDVDSRVYLLISGLTIGLGVFLVALYIKTPVSSEVERTLYLIVASALLPAGLLWTLEHYFLQKPIEERYESVVERYRQDQRGAETIQSAEKHSLYIISSERAVVARRVLEGALDTEACREIIIVGSTLDGLFRQGSWFEDFVKKSLRRQQELKLMFTHWDYVTHREKQEDRPDGAIAVELKESLTKALSWGIPAESIRLVRGAPTVFMVIAGNNMMLNPYPYGRESVTSMAIWLTNPDPSQPEGAPGTIWQAYYINHYDMVWHPDRYPRELNMTPEPISCFLPDDWEEQISRFISGVIDARR